MCRKPIGRGSAGGHTLEAVRVEFEVVLPVPVDRSWAALVDWESQPGWMQDAVRVDVVSESREGVGTELAVKTRVLGVPTFTDRLEVVAWKPPGLMRIAHRRFIRGEGTWRIEPISEGARFTWTEEVSLPGGRIGELALVAYRPFMRRLMRRSMAGLRDSLISAGPRRR
jgi:hypothetical protein